MKKCTSYSVTFYVKKSKPLKDGSIPIFVRININSQTSEFSVGESIQPKMWNSKKTEVIGNSIEAKKINLKLNKIKVDIEDCYLKMSVNDEIVNSLTVKNRYLGEGIKVYSVVQLYDEHLLNIQSKIGKGYTFSTYTRHKQSRNNIEAFIRTKYRTSDIDVKSVDSKFIEMYNLYLINKKDSKANTRGKELKNLKTIINNAFHRGLIHANPFLGFKMPSEKVDKDPLTSKELHTIRNKTFNAQRLELTRDMFVFCCYTGLAFSDIKNLKKSDINTHHTGRKFLEIRRQKTKSKCIIPLLPPALKVVETYKNHPIAELKQSLLPIGSLNGFNNNLKTIAELCEINKMLTTHIGRYTFITTIASENGLSLENIAAITGQSSLKIVEHYSKVRVDNVMDKTIGLDEKFKNH